MAEARVLNLDAIKGMTVLRADTGEKAGEVADLIIHPTEGRVLALAVRDSHGEVSTIETRSFLIGADAVMASKDAEFQKISTARSDSGVPASSRLIGAKVVTETGTLIGRVSHIYISIEEPRAVYQVAESQLQRFFGGGFFISGDTPSAYSSEGVRMIVPSDVEEHFATSSVSEALHRKNGLGSV